MKRPLFIIIGALVVIILLAIWIYVLFFNTPQSTDEEFADFNFGDTTDVTLFPDSPDLEADPEPIVNVLASDRLKQLTTTPVVGYGEVTTGTIPTEILYVAAGTGHIFSINLASGEEERISGTTIPSSQVAKFAGNGEFVMIQSGFGIGANFTVGQISSSSGELITSTIDERVISFSGTDSGRFLYAVQTNNSVIGKIYNPVTLATDTLFTVPFREAAIVWGAEAADSHYIYPKASTQLEGFLYEANDGVLSRLPIDGFGLSATGDNDFILYSKQTPDDYQSFLFNRTTNQESPFTFTQIPEKCVFSSNENNSSICANTEISYGDMMPNSWYTGEISFSDSLYLLDNTSGNGVLLADTLFETGQSIDAINLVLGVQDASLYFSNKNDQTLWLYVMTPTFLLE